MLILLKNGASVDPALVTGIRPFEESKYITSDLFFPPKVLVDSKGCGQISIEFTDYEEAHDYALELHELVNSKLTQHSYCSEFKDFSESLSKFVKLND